MPRLDEHDFLPSQKGKNKRVEQCGGKTSTSDLKMWSWWLWFDFCNRSSHIIFGDMWSNEELTLTQYLQSDVTSLPNTKKWFTKSSIQHPSWKWTDNRKYWRRFTFWRSSNHKFQFAMQYLGKPQSWLHKIIYNVFVVNKYRHPAGTFSHVLSVVRTPSHVFLFPRECSISYEKPIKPSWKTTEEDEEEIREATASMAASDEIKSAVAVVLSGPDGIFTWNEQRTALQSFLRGK